MARRPRRPWDYVDAVGWQEPGENSAAMEDTQTISGLLDKLNASKLVPGSEHKVEATHVNNPKSFYVQLVHIADDMPRLDKLLRRQKGPQISMENLKVGKLIVYDSKTHHKLVRGRIELIESKENHVECKAFAIDYGCREQVLLEHIYLLNMGTEIPPLALHCELHLCEPRGDDFDDEAVETMKYFVGKHMARISIVVNAMDKLTVVLNTVECPDDVATTLAHLLCTQMLKSGNQVNRFSVGASSMTSHPYCAIRYKKKEIKLHEKFYVRALGGGTVDSFYVAEVNDYNKYRKWGSDFTQYCKRQKVVNVAEAVVDGQCCGVKVSDAFQYERAYVKEEIEPGFKALVKLIDKGSEEIVNCDLIKSVSSALYTSEPGMAIHCASTMSQVNNNKLSRFLYPGYEYIIEIIELGNEDGLPHKVNLYQKNF